MRRLAASILSSSAVCFALLLSGCAMQSGDGPASSVDVQGTAHGTVYGGQQPIVGSTVTLWQAGYNGYGTQAKQLAQVQTGQNGGFTFAGTSYTCDYSNSPLYITARGGDAGAGPNDNIELMATIGPCSSAATAVVDINEVTTVASVWALQGFLSTQLGSSATPLVSGTVAGFTGSSYNIGMTNALYYTAPTLVDMSQGTVQASNSTVTIESSKIVSLANILASCINSSGETSTTETTTPCGTLFGLTNVNNSNPRPYTTLQAALMIAKYPYWNTAALFNRVGANPPFQGGLGSTPNDWTVGVSFPNSTMGVGLNGSASSSSGLQMDIDLYGRVWFPSTMPATSGIAYFDPTTRSYSQVYGHGILSHPQNLVIDQLHTVWATDAASGNIFSLSTDTFQAASYNEATMMSAGGALSVDQNDNVLFGYTRASDGTARLGNVSSSNGNIADTQAGFAVPAVGIQANTDATGSVYVSYATPGGACYMGHFDGTNATQITSVGSSCFAGGIANVGNTTYTNPASAVVVASTANQLCVYGEFDTPVNCNAAALGLNQPTGIATDGAGDLWIANAGNSSIVTQHGARAVVNGSEYNASSSVAYLHGAGYGGTLTTPYALQIDGSGNVWTLSPGCVTNSSTPCTPNGMVLSELVGAATPTIAPVSMQISGYVGTRPTR